MVFSLIVISTILLLGAAVFLLLVADAYLHVPAQVKVDVRREMMQKRKRG